MVQPRKSSEGDQLPLDQSVDWGLEVGAKNSKVKVQAGGFPKYRGQVLELARAPLRTKRARTENPKGLFIS